MTPKYLLLLTHRCHTNHIIIRATYPYSFAVKHHQGRTRDPSTFRFVVFCKSKVEHDFAVSVLTSLGWIYRFVDDGELLQ